MNCNTLSLQEKFLECTSQWNELGIKTPQFDIKKNKNNTFKNPAWIHFGAGNIFRGYIAQIHQELLNKQLADTGIIAVESFDLEIIDAIYKPYDNLSLVVGLKSDGSTNIEIVASLTEALKANAQNTEDWQRLKKIFSSPSLQMVSFTITEKGYALFDLNDSVFPIVQSDIRNGPEMAIHTMSIVTSLMYERFLSGAFPIALVSMDNCSKNGEKLRSAIVRIAQAWEEQNFVNKDFISYLQDVSKVSYPWTMIDKITPRPSKQIEQKLTDLGISAMEAVITSKNTYIAPFVNAEIPQYLVIEDNFPNGRPLLEKAGVLFTQQETVTKTEQMKVTTCLNPLHTALAIFGCLLGYERISDEMKNPLLHTLVSTIGYTEGLPVVIDPKIIKPIDFLNEVITERLPNPFIPDAPQRIATDTSQKIGIRFGETLKAYLKNPSLNIDSLTAIPLTIAGWFRYLLAIDDFGNAMKCSSDPMLEELQRLLQGIKFGNPSSYKKQLIPILSNKHVFGLDLVEHGLSAKIEKMFVQMIVGVGSVQKTLELYVKEPSVGPL